MHDYWPFAATIVAIFIGILFNRRDFNRVETRLDRIETELRKEIGNVRTEIASRLDRIEADLREFYRSLGDHGARIDNLEKRSK